MVDVAQAAERQVVILVVMGSSPIAHPVRKSKIRNPKSKISEGRCFMVQANAIDSVIHVRFAGQSFDIPLSVLGLGASSSERDVKRTLARHLEVQDSRLNDYVVDRHTNGNLTL